MRPFSVEKIPKPKDFCIFPFDVNLPLDVEIGCGVGFHPISYAKANPKRQLLAFERTDKFFSFERRVKNHSEMKNLFPVHGDAISWISHLFGPERVDRYFILYPNPYPKKKQENLRFPHMPFFSHLVLTMKKGGTVEFATNCSSYGADIEKQLPAQGLTLQEKRVVDRDCPPRTHFEKKYLSRGEACWSYLYRK